MERLHAGERAAISLAVELNAVLLIDEHDGREAAQSRGLRVIGAIGILERAANMGLVEDLRTVYRRIRECDFRISAQLMEASLARHLAHRKPMAGFRTEEADKQERGA